MNHVRAWYFVLANTALFFLALQLGAWVFLQAYDRAVPALLAPVDSEAVKRNYAHLRPEEFEALRVATRQQRFRFEPGVGLLPDVLTSPLLNVDAHGIRSNGTGHRPISALDGALWFFGGSTTFGERIADRETIPAHLERAIARPVINLGVPGYDSARENMLLAHYLRIGYRPGLTLFLDGINETCQPEMYDAEIRELFRVVQRDNFWDVGGPMVRLLRRAGRKAQKIAGVYEDADPKSLACSRDGKQNALAVIHSRIMSEREGLCRAYQIDCRTLVQPFAGTHGPSHELPQAFLSAEAHVLRDLYHHLEPGWRTAGAVFVTDALDGYQRHPFVDEVHYSADASRVIADAIATRLALR